MKVLLVLIFLNLFSAGLSAQTKPAKTVYLSKKQIGVRIVKKEFPNVPENVRDCHAQGMMRMLAFVDEAGNVEKAEPVSSLCKAVGEYLKKTVSNWKFKPLAVDEKNVSFKAVIEIPFCYGSFSSWCFY
jgi:hypothetical protein